MGAAKPVGAAAALMLLAACSRGQDAPGEPPEATGSPVAVAEPAEADESIDPASETPPPVPLAAQDLVLAEWRKADNRNTCTPVSFGETGVGGSPRRADFSGGWAVAWDRPGLRSAFGVAGTGFMPEDESDTAAQRSRLAAQWPYFTELESLPRPAFAGYGVQGAQDYPPGNPDGRGLESLAYVRIGGQTCDYNVWSKLGRAHLEMLLDNLRVAPR